MASTAAEPSQPTPTPLQPITVKMKIEILTKLIGWLELGVKKYAIEDWRNPQGETKALGEKSDAVGDEVLAMEKAAKNINKEEFEAWKFKDDPELAKKGYGRLIYDHTSLNCFEQLAPIKRALAVETFRTKIGASPVGQSSLPKYF